MSALALRGLPRLRAGIRSISGGASAFGVQHVCKGIGRLSNMVLTRGEGSWVWSDDGARHLDMTSGLGVCNLGHCHPTVVKAAQAQLGQLMHGQVNIAFHRPMLDLIERLQRHLPPPLDTFFFWNSGAEAVEAAVKLSRHATGRQAVIVAQGGYHGRTIGTMAMTTSKTVYSAGFGPLMPGVFTIPYPYSTQLQMCADVPPQLMVDHCLRAFEDLLDQSVAPRDVACVVVEPILGEGGYVAAPPEYLEGVQALCRQHGILLVLDEVQSGFWRAGEMFAFQRTPHLVPDVLIFAKGVANGLPLSGIVSSKALMDTQPPGSMGGTYAGNAVACAAAIAVLDVFEQGDVVVNLKERSRQFAEGLESIRARLRLPIRELRVYGLMLGLEFDTTCAPGTASQVAKAALNHNLLLLTCSKYEVLRFIPPLTVSEAEVEEALRRFELAARDVFGG